MSRQFKQFSLFKSILLWVTLSIVAYTTLSAVWGQGSDWRRILTGWQLGAGHDSLDRIKVTLTALGGIGAVGYLVIKYRERSAFERGEADDKLVRAVQQLGDTSPQVRIAGVYALADVADTYEGPYHQRVVDILCGYLRTDRLHKDANGNTRYFTNKDGTPDHDNPLSTDGAVESTILSVLASHLRTTSENSFEEKTSPGPWSHCTLNLQRTTLTESINFTGSHIGALNAQDLKLTGHVSFQDSVFTNHAVFINSFFTHDVDFSGTTFTQQTHFSGTTFKGGINLNGTYFTDVYFDGVEFEQKTSFTLTTFTAEAIFEDLSCRQEIQFRDVTFLGYVNFNGAIFHQFVDFGDAKFYEETTLERTTFKRDTYFLGATFMERSRFSNSTFYGIADFTGTTFKEGSNFADVTFGDVVSFWGVNFTHNTTFHNTKFKRDANFRRSSLPPNASFIGAHFLGNVDFWGTKFKNRPNRNEYDCFLHAKFNPDPDVHLFFPDGIKTNSEGLPEGAKWITFDSLRNPALSNDQYRDCPTGEQAQPDKVTPADCFPQDEGGEEDGD